MRSARALPSLPRRTSNSTAASPPARIHATSRPPRRRLRDGGECGARGLKQHTGEIVKRVRNGERLLVAMISPADRRAIEEGYLATNLTARSDRSGREDEDGLAPASVAEVARLCGLRMRVEQGYKQVGHTLAWIYYQVRKDIAATGS